MSEDALPPKRDLCQYRITLNAEERVAVAHANELTNFIHEQGVLEGQFSCKVGGELLDVIVRKRAE